MGSFPINPSQLLFFLHPTNTVGEGDMKTMNKKERSTQHYSSSQKILFVGEGDFSFSACLARQFGSAVNMVATSLDPEGVLHST